MTDMTGFEDRSDATQPEMIGPIRAPRRMSRAESRQFERRFNEERVRQSRQREGMQAAELIGSRAEELDRNRRLLEVDWNNQTDWLLMNDYVKQLITLRPSVLEGQRITLDPETVLDYALYGTPRSPGVMMSGASEYFIFDDRLQRYVNASFATEEQMREFGNTMYARRPNGQMVEFSGTSTPQIPEFEPLSESMLGTAARGIATAAGAVGAVAAAPVAAIAGRWQGPTTPVLGISDIEGFPAQPGPDGRINFGTVDEWLRDNVNRLDTAEIQAVARFLAIQKNQMIDPMSTQRPPEVATIEQSQQRLVRRETNIATAAAAVSGVPVERPGELSVESRQREAMDRAQAQFLRSKARAANIAERLRPIKGWEFSAVPLGFAESEFTRVRPNTPEMARLQEIKETLESGKATGDQQRVNDLLTEQATLTTTVMNQPQEDVFIFQPESTPYSSRDRLMSQQAVAWQQTALGAIPEQRRSQMEGRGRALQASAYRSMLTEITKPEQLLTEQGALSQLRGIAENADSMVKLKQRLAFVYGGEDKYTSDTAIDERTITNWFALVSEANRAGKQPMPYLMSLMQDPSVQKRAAERNRGGGGGFTIRLPAVEDIQTVVQDVAQKRIGMRLDDTAAAQIAQAYLGTVEQQMRSQAGASTVREPMAAETFAEQQIQEDLGAEVDVYAMGSVLDSFTRLLGGGQ